MLYSLCPLHKLAGDRRRKRESVSLALSLFCIKRSSVIAFQASSLTARLPQAFCIPIYESFHALVTMPVYRATGIKATLSTASLEDSLDKHFLSTAIAAHKRGSEYSAGQSAVWRDLQERPLNEKRDRYGVIRFLGPHEDMPFFAVEAAEDLHTSDNLQTQAVEVASARSSRQSLNPGSTEDRDAFGEAQGSRGFSQDQHPASELNITTEATPTRTIAARQRLKGPDIKQITKEAMTKEKEPRPMKESALLLRIDIQEHKDKLPRWPRAVNSNAVPELKVEVFLHGELADVVFLNKSRNAVQLHDDTMLIFHGTRVARQLERPWIYQAGQSVGKGDLTAAQRWLTCQKLLRDEAMQRGTDKYGVPSPSGEFLQALSALDLPDNLQHHAHLSVIDVVITTGKGKKFS
jgi:hypothetical protein